MAGHFKDLIAWRKAMDLVVGIYQVTGSFPKRENFALADQLRRAAVSIPSNIAEGQAHHSPREFVHFLQHARGSLAEVETQVRIAFRLGYISIELAKEMVSRTDELGRILNGLIASQKQVKTQSASAGN